MALRTCGTADGGAAGTGTRGGIGNKRFGPSHAVMGIDAKGCIHHVDYGADRVVVISPDGERLWVEDMAGVPQEKWAKHIDDVRGWASMRMIFVPSDFGELEETQL